MTLSVHSTGGYILNKPMTMGFLSIIILIIYLVFIKEKFPVVDELPVVMKKEYDVVFNDRMNSVSLEKDGEFENVAISIDKGKTLYIANSVGHNITKFTINKDKKEIYISRNIFDYKNGNNDKFQLN
jgi:chromosome condensin MukBEF MukE localization factor